MKTQATRAMYTPTITEKLVVRQMWHSAKALDEMNARTRNRSYLSISDHQLDAQIAAKIPQVFPNWTSIGSSTVWKIRTQSEEQIRSKGDARTGGRPRILSVDGIKSVMERISKMQLEKGVCPYTYQLREMVKYA